jgi:hypothetical protein
MSLFSRGLFYFHSRLHFQSAAGTPEVCEQEFVEIWLARHCILNKDLIHKHFFSVLTRSLLLLQV